jgi:hypothetical protein
MVFTLDRVRNFLSRGAVMTNPNGQRAVGSGAYGDFPSFYCSHGCGPCLVSHPGCHTVWICRRHGPQAVNFTLTPCTHAKSIEAAIAA